MITLSVSHIVVVFTIGLVVGMMIVAPWFWKD